LQNWVLEALKLNQLIYLLKGLRVESANSSNTDHVLQYRYC
jgi:hypothetical protein